MPWDKKLVTLQSGAILEIWPKPGAATILFYPGTMLAPGHYSLFLSSLYQKGLGVAGLHFNGHGKAIKSPIGTFEDMLFQGGEAIDWLLARGLGPVGVCGHSQGGILALAQGQDPDIALCFSICAVFPEMEEAIYLTRFAPLRKYRGQLLRMIKVMARVFPGLPIPLPVYLSLHKLVAGKLKPVYMGKDKGRISYPMRFLASLFDAVIEPRLRCPYILFAAKNDRLFDMNIIQATFDRVEAPEKRLIWLPDGGHMAPLNPTLCSFISGHISAICVSAGMPVNTGDS